MKTITEFSGFALKDALAKKAALLTEGKTEDEAQTVINELLKLADETKVAFYKNAVDMSKSRIDQVKRVVIAEKSSETEKVPEAFSEREGKFYLLEFFPSTQAPQRGRKEERFGRGRDRSGPRDRNDRTERTGRRPERTDRFKAAESGGPKPPRERSEQGERKPRPPREARPQTPRPPRGPRPQQGPKGAAELRLVLKGQGPSTLQGSLPASAVSSVEKAGSDTQPGSN